MGAARPPHMQSQHHKLSDSVLLHIVLLEFLLLWLSGREGGTVRCRVPSPVKRPSLKSSMSWQPYITMDHTARSKNGHSELPAWFKPIFWMLALYLRTLGLLSFFFVLLVLSTGLGLLLLGETELSLARACGEGFLSLCTTHSYCIHDAPMQCRLAYHERPSRWPMLRCHAGHLPSRCCQSCSLNNRLTPFWKLKLLGPDFFRWGGDLLHEGVGGQKVWYDPGNPGKTHCLAGYPGSLPGFPRVPEKFEKTCAQCLSPKASF